MAVNNPLTCEIVERELAVPSGTVQAAAVGGHVAGCERCAERAEASRRFDAAWRSTRPEVPGPEVWAGLWSHIEAEAPSHAATLRCAGTSPDDAARERRRWVAAVWAVAAVAQAAAIGLAYLVLTRPGADSPAALARASAVVASPASPSAASPIPAATGDSAVAQVEYELDEGYTLFLVLDERADRVVVRPRFVSTTDLIAFDGETPDPVANAVQIDMELLNALEGME